MYGLLSIIGMKTELDYLIGDFLHALQIHHQLFRNPKTEVSAKGAA